MSCLLAYLRQTEAVIKTLLLIPIMVCSYSRYVYYNKKPLLFINMWRLVNKDLALQQTLYVADQSKAMLSTFFIYFSTYESDVGAVYAGLPVRIKFIY